MEVKGERLARYRYLTGALAGRWHKSAAAARRDAVRARQANEDEKAPDGLKWLVPGRIEVETGRREHEGGPRPVESGLRRHAG